MSSDKDLDELANHLIHAQELSERAEHAQIKLLVELAMFEVGRLIAQRSLRPTKTSEVDID